MVELPLVLIDFVPYLVGKDNIREFIAFPKNNQGRDVMIEAPSEIDQIQLDELEFSLPKLKD